MYDQTLNEYNLQCRATGEVPSFYGFIKYGKWSVAMTAMLFRYLQCCRAYGWEPCLVGLMLFPKQIEDGIRKGEVLC